MTKTEKDKIIKKLAEDRNNYARDCDRRIAIESGRVSGADYMIQRFLDILKSEDEPYESDTCCVYSDSEVAKSFIDDVEGKED